MTQKIDDLFEGNRVSQRWSMEEENSRDPVPSFYLPLFLQHPLDSGKDK